jgi:hypothetical protein
MKHEKEHPQPLYESKHVASERHRLVEELRGKGKWLGIAKPPRRRRRARRALREVASGSR